MTKRVWVLLGASRGLGRAFYEQALASDPELNFLIAARKTERLDELKGLATERVQTYPVDLSDSSQRQPLWGALQTSVLPERVFYFAGGGPYGAFSGKEIKDHRWAIETTFMGALEAVHASLRCSVRQVILVGSAVAEDKSDPQAASYSAAKHALLGLLKSLWDEPLGDLDLRLFSPGYMDTSLLPPRATARQQKLISVQEAASQLLDWCLDPKGPRHYKLTT